MNDSSGLLRRANDSFQKEAGHSLVVWALIALFGLVTQIVFRRQLSPGEFGTLNTALGVIGLMTVPIVALRQAFVWYLAQPHPADQADRIAALRAASLLITETLAWTWAGLALLLMFPLLTLIELPRTTVCLFTSLNVLVGIAGIVSGVICHRTGRAGFWAGLLVTAAVVRVGLAVGLTPVGPWAEAALATFLFAGFITLIPVLRQEPVETSERLKALRALLDFDFLFYLGATFSVLLAIFLFSSADRIIAQSWFGAATNNNIHYIDWPAFDAYQTAGLLGRSVLWGTQPLLLLWFAQRSRLPHTTTKSMTWCWVYLGALFAGVIALIVLPQFWSWIFCGADFALSASFLPSFAIAMVPLGLLQAISLFALASRRFHECFVLGGCGVGYALLLELAGRRAELMPAYMFGGGLVALMIVLFVGVVRWGRKQP